MTIIERSPEEGCVIRLNTLKLKHHVRGFMLFREDYTEEVKKVYFAQYGGKNAPATNPEAMEKAGFVKYIEAHNERAGGTGSQVPKLKSLTTRNQVDQVPPLIVAVISILGLHVARPFC